MTDIRIKVYGWTSFYPRGFSTRTKNCRMFVAAKSKAEVGRIMDTAPHNLQNLSETGNTREIEVANQAPGFVFLWDEINHTPGEHVAVTLLAAQGLLAPVDAEPGLQATMIAYLESKGWYFDWDYVREHDDPDDTHAISRRPDAIRVLHGWTVPQWGEYWSSDHLDPVGPKPRARRYENMKDALWAQLLREEDPERFAGSFKEAS